jgi:Leucine Rich repeats (2 copies)
VKTIRFIRRLTLLLLVLAKFVTSTLAQEVSIPDPGLNAAIREALQKPNGPLTEQDLLSLTDLDANSRNISSLQGLEAAHNLTGLDLRSNHLANLSFPNGLTKLTFLDLSFNPLTNCFFPAGLTNLDRLLIKSGQLTNLTLPADLRALIEFDLGDNHFTSFDLPSNLTALGVLDLSANHLQRSFTVRCCKPAHQHARTETYLRKLQRGASPRFHGRNDLQF